MNNNLERLALVEGALSCSVSTLRKIAIEDPTAEYSGKVARETLLLIDKLVNAQGAATRPAEQGQPAIGAPVPLSTAEQKVFRKTIGLVTTCVDAISLARHLRETDDIEHITRKEIMLLVQAILEMDALLAECKRQREEIARIYQIVNAASGIQINPVIQQRILANIKGQP